MPYLTKSGRPHANSVPVRERILRNIEVVTESGCWIWMSDLNNGGYGLLKFGRKRELAHRISYREFRGSIPEGLELDHLCRVRCCVNPDHLEPVTKKENVNRSPRCLNKLSRTHCKRGHPWSEENTYWINSQKRLCRVCSRELLRSRRVLR